MTARDENHSEFGKTCAELCAEIDRSRLETRFLFALLALLIILTNPRVADWLGRLFSIVR
ncbi:MAG: hypothetical protein HY327_04665 [Chloroflexi bacterium]|nr:hypothetical protein [Chloroflexota bacterium]